MIAKQSEDQQQVGESRQPIWSIKYARAFVETIRREVFWNWDSLHSPAPAALYHYTTAEGVEGILHGTAPTLHATHAAFLNDPREVLYAETFLTQQFKKRQSAFDPGSFYTLFYQELLDQLPKVIKSREMYICSFSEEGDLLSQWMSYAGKGRGYAIGFHGAKLGGIYPAAPENVLLRRVIYPEFEQTEHLNRLFDAIEKFVANYSAKVRGPNPAEVAKTFAFYIGELVEELLVCFKHVAFKDEREWRLCVVRRFNSEWAQGQLPGVQFRAGSGRLVPYIPLPLDQGDKVASRLANIYLGPALDKNLDLRALESFLQVRNLPNVASPSSIALR